MVQCHFRHYSCCDDEENDDDCDPEEDDSDRSVMIQVFHMTDEDSEAPHDEELLAVLQDDQIQPEVDEDEGKDGNVSEAAPAD